MIFVWRYLWLLAIDSSFMIWLQHNDNLFLGLY